VEEALMSSRLLSIMLLFILASSSPISLVGASSEMWSRTYGSAGQEGAYAVVETSDGGFAMAGLTFSFGAVGGDFWLVKTDADGNMEWNQKYGGAETEIAYSLVETPDGGYALAGYTYSFGAGNNDFWLVKTDQYGNMEWNRTYGGAEFDRACSLIVASDGGLVLAGYKDLQVNYVGANFWLIKTDAYGNIEWNQTYSNGVDRANSVIETSDGGYVLAGSVGFWTPQACWLVKTDENGFMDWDKTYGDLRGLEEEVARSIVEVSDRGYVLAGYTESLGAGGKDFWLIKTDAKGTMEWNQTYGGAEDDIARSLIVTSDEGFAIAGETSSFGAGDLDFWLVKTDEYGGIPEFPSWTPLLTILVIVIVMAVVYRRRLTKSPGMGEE
jgi:hypothetical protein